jgi:2-keto-3-deoxy-L-rhamnonate aldolase RhmA
VAAPAGIIFPQVNTAEQATAVLQTAKYLPGGISEALVSKGVVGFGIWFDEYLHRLLKYSGTGE